MVEELTLKPGVLQVASAFPDPPFEVEIGGADTGFDVELMQQICLALGLAWHPVRYTGDDFNGIFDGLAEGSYDAVISGTTITPGRKQKVLFSDPYHGILTALDDLAAGHIGAFIKLFPVVHWLVKDRPELAVVQQIPTHEKLGIAFAKSNLRLCAAVNETLANIKERGIFGALRRKWFAELQKE